MIIVLEGPDGCGKSSIGKALAERIGGEVIEFPARKGTVTGPLIDSYLKKEWGLWEVSGEGRPAWARPVEGALAFQALQTVNRLEVLPRMKKITDAGIPLILVRYWQSGFVYGCLDGLEPEWLVGIHRTLPRAELNILLDIPATVSMQRRAQRDGELPPERYEGKWKFTQLVQQKYQELWETNSHYGYGGRWQQVNANRKFEDVLSVVTGFVTHP